MAGGGPGGGGGGIPGALMPGIGGGGGGDPGAPIGGIGGGGGAPLVGIGGGGGGADGASNSFSPNEPGIGGGGGGAEGGDTAVDRSWTGVCGLLSIAESGLGGAIVPKSRDASCLADPPVGASSSSLSCLSDPASDHSSSSFLRRETDPVMVGVSGFAASCCASLANGLVDGRSRAGGENGAACGTGGGENAG